MDKKRRNFLKIILIGGGAFLVGKIFGPRVLSFFSSSQFEVEKDKVEKDFGNFRITEDKEELIISDKNGEEIFIIDKEE